MKNKVVNISNQLIEEITKEKDKLLDLKVKNKYEAKVILDYIEALQRQETLLEILIEESDDEEYIMENKADIKIFFQDVRKFCSKIPC